MISFHSQLNICLLFGQGMFDLNWRVFYNLWLPMLTINLHERDQKHTLTKLEQIDTDNIKRKQKKHYPRILMKYYKKAWKKHLPLIPVALWRAGHGLTERLFASVFSRQRQRLNSVVCGPVCCIHPLHATATYQTRPCSNSCQESVHKTTLYSSS